MIPSLQKKLKAYKLLIYSENIRNVLYILGTTPGFLLLNTKGYNNCIKFFNEINDP